MNSQYMLPNTQQPTSYQPQPTHMHPDYDPSFNSPPPHNPNQNQNGPFPPLYPQPPGHNQNGLPQPMKQIPQMPQMPMPPATSAQMAMSYPPQPPRPGPLGPPGPPGPPGQPLQNQGQYLPPPMIRKPAGGTANPNMMVNRIANMNIGDNQIIQKPDGGYYPTPISTGNMMAGRGDTNMLKNQQIQQDGGQFGGVGGGGGGGGGYYPQPPVSSGPPMQGGGPYPPPQSTWAQGPPLPPSVVGNQYPPGGIVGGGKFPPQQQMIGQPQMPPQQQFQQQQFPQQQQQQQQSMYPQQQQQQQPRRLDPDQMPSPIQVIEDDKKKTSVFVTTTPGQIPPLVTTDFVTQDQGNCNPRFMRSSIYSVPISPDILKQTGVPFAVVISPFAELLAQEYAPPCVDMGELGPVRCVRCKAYMCPYMQFMDGGRRFQCGFCKGTTEVPPEYFAHLDHTGHRLDKFERPELCLGSYEFVATKDYCKNNVVPKPPAFIFVIDVSFSNVKNGMVNLLCENIKQVLKEIPKEGDIQPKVGFITYSNTVHFYNVKSSLAQPQMMVVSDVHDMFMPLLDGFLVDVIESESIVDSLMEQIETIFADSSDTETILGPAIQAGLEALKAADCSGKLLVFHATLPIAEAPGKLRTRDDRKLLGTEKEKTILMPQNNFYTQLGQDCVTAGCSVDLFLFPTVYIDIATIGQVSRLTGGQVYKYTYFQSDIDGNRFLEDLKKTIRCSTAFDAIMRVRTSTGVRPTDFYGNYYMSNTTDVELAIVDCDKAISVEIKHDDKLTEEDAVYIQAAILFTSVGGQRRLRIHNLSLTTCSQMADLYRNCELDTIINYFAKSALRHLMEQVPKVVKDQLISRCAQILACYRKHCATPSLAGQLILPECMKLLPLYANCLLKSDAIAGGSELLVDDRSFMMTSLASMDVKSTVALFYPRLLPLHDVDVNGEDLPVALRCSYDKLQDDGAYLLENGIYMFIWIGNNITSDWIQNVFSIQSVNQIDIDRTKLLDLDNPLSQRIRFIVDKVQSERHRCMRLIIVRQRDKLEMVFKHFLVEDKGLADNTPSYVDFLCHLHKEIRSLLS